MIIAQISDTHITLSSDEAAVRTSANLQRAVAHLLALPAPPDVVLISGDCVNHGQPEEYDRFEELISPLPMPVYVVPGNHDSRTEMLRRFGQEGTQRMDGFMQYVVKIGPLRLVALDTHVLGSDGGHLCEQRLRWLDERLAEAPDHPTVLFMHHPPIKVGFAPTDGIGLDNAEAFAAIVARYPNVLRIVAGHVHMALTQPFGGSVVMTCPALAHTMLPDFSKPDILSVLFEPPMGLVHHWTDGTGLTTYTSQIGDHGPAVTIHDGNGWVA